MSWEGDDHRKATWITISLAESNPSSVGVDHMIHDGQPQAAMALPSPCRIQALKGLQSTFPITAGYSLALVPDFNRYLRSRLS